jgi:hypothetical protein
MKNRIGWFIPALGAIAATSCNQVDTGTERTSLQATLTDLVSQNLAIDWAGYDGNLCIDDVGCFGPPATGALQVTIPQGRHRFYSSNNVSILPELYTTIGYFTVDAEGKATLEGLGFARDSASSIRAVTAPVTLDCAGYPCFVGFDGSGRSYTSGQTAHLLSGRRYYVADYGSQHLGPSGGYIVSPSYDFTIDAAGAVNVGPETGASFVWNSDQHSLRVRTVQVSIDDRGYPGTFVIGTQPQGGPGLRSWTLMRNRRYLAGDHESADPAGRGWGFGAADLRIEGDQLVLGPETARYFQQTPGQPYLEARVGTITYNATTYFHTGGGNCLQNGGDRLSHDCIMLLGRQYPLAPGGGNWVFGEDGTCNPTVFSLSGGTVTFQCRTGTTAPPSPCGASQPGAPCDDGNPCTTGDACDGAGTCVGGPEMACEAAPLCNPSRCNPATGACEPYLAAAGTPCSDHDSCTRDDACDGAGVCAAGQQICNPATPTTFSVAVRVVNAAGQPMTGIPVVPLSGSATMGPGVTTGADGVAQFELPLDSYRFSADIGGRIFLSSTQDDCLPGYCQLAYIEYDGTSTSAVPFFLEPTRSCASIEQCQGLAETGRTVEVVATDASRTRLFHAFRSDGRFPFEPQFQTPFGDVLAQAGAPWSAGLTPDEMATIDDVAVQAHGDKLLVLALVKVGPRPCASGDIREYCCNPLFGDCQGKPQPPAPTFTLWSSERLAASWTPFEPWPITAGVSFRSISLSGRGIEDLSFCGATTNGRIVFADNDGSGWGPLVDLQELAGEDPGFVSKVACQRDFGGLPLTVAALVGQRVKFTFVNPARTIASRVFDRAVDAVNAFHSPGFADLTTQLNAPADATFLALEGIERVNELHLVVGTTTGTLWHALYNPATLWGAVEHPNSALGLVDPPNAELSLRAAGVSSGAGHLQVFSVTSDGRLAQSVRHSGDIAFVTNWAGYRLVDQISGLSFGQVVASERFLIPRAPGAPSLSFEDSAHTRLRVNWVDLDDFETGFQVYDGLTAFLDPVPAIPGIGSVGGRTVPWDVIEPGRRYMFSVRSIGPGGHSWAIESPAMVHTAVAQPTRPSYDSSGFFCHLFFLHFPRCTPEIWFDWSYQPTTKGPARMEGTDYVEIVGERTFEGNMMRTWSSGRLKPGTTHYSIDYWDFVHYPEPFSGWKFWVLAVGPGGTPVRQSPINEDNVDPDPPIGGVGGVPLSALPQPPLTAACCSEKTPVAGEE